jgi:hypothetical protein
VGTRSRARVDLAGKPVDNACPPSLSAHHDPGWVDSTLSRIVVRPCIPAIVAVDKLNAVIAVPKTGYTELNFP